MSIKNKNADDIIEALGLTPHVEGGYYSQVYRSAGECEIEGKPRAYATSIYFLLKSGQASHLHSLKSDELWYFHFGCPLRITLLSSDGVLSEQILGTDILSGQRPQITIPAGSVFAAELLHTDKVSAEDYAGASYAGASYAGASYALVSCMVAPGFEYEDFHLPSRNDLKEKFPQHVAIIERLTV